MNKNTKYLIFALGIILVMGLMHVPYPFCGDQAFFLLGAREMNDGMVLYRDFWDIKQPGVFFFYLLAGKLFGFTSQGIHIFEMLYWFTFSIIFIWFLKKGKFFRNEMMNYLTPVILMGVYYGFSFHRFLTQVEALIGFPLMMVLVFNYLYLKSTKRKYVWLLLSGFAGGVVLFFKLIFAPILAGFWVWLWIQDTTAVDWKKRMILLVKTGIYLLAGILVAWFPFLLYAWYYDILELCYRTFLQYPPLIVQYGQKRPVHDLIQIWKNFFDSLNFFWPLALISLLIVHRNKFLSISMWIWLVSGIVVVLMQVTSWYPYQFQLLYFPLIMLAMHCLDYIIEKAENIRHEFVIKQFRLVKFLLIMLLASPVLIALSAKLKELKDYHFAFHSQDQIAFATSLKDNLDAWKIAQAIPKLKICHPRAFVIDDPLVYYYTGLKQATTQSGWSMQLFIPGQMDTLLQELKSHQPELIFYYNRYQEFMNLHGPQVEQWIHENYRAAVNIPEGTWYICHKD